MKMGASATPNEEEVGALFLASEEIGPLWAYATEDAGWQAVVAMRYLVRDLYNNRPQLIDLGASALARNYRAICCKATCRPYPPVPGGGCDLTGGQSCTFGGGVGGDVCG